MGIREIVADHIRAKQGDDVLFPRKDWAYEVDNDDTTASYDDWHASKIETECDEVEQAVDRLLHGAPRVFIGDSTEVQFNQIVIDCFSTFRAENDEAPIRARGITCEEEPDYVFGNTCKVMPEDLQHALGRIAHQGMVAYEGRTEHEILDFLIHRLGKDFDINSDEIDAARSRLQIDERPAP